LFLFLPKACRWQPFFLAQYSPQIRPQLTETTCNSLFRNILQGTSLFSVFCSDTLSATYRKQGLCVQNMGGGTPRRKLRLGTMDL
jgi:hypothetical protein